MDLRRDNRLGELVQRIRNRGEDEGPIRVCGTWGSYARFAAGHISKELGRPVLYVCAHIDDADNAADDLGTVFGGRVETLSVWEDELEVGDASDEIGAQRLRLVMEAGSGKAAFCEAIVCAGAQALIRPVPKAEVLQEQGLSIHAGDVIEPELVCQWLVDNGFERVDQVDVPGQFAMRGGILDIFASAVRLQRDEQAGGQTDNAAAVRVEFFGDTVESLREIDLDTQRSKEDAEGVFVAGSAVATQEEGGELFLNLLPEDTIVLVEEPATVQEVAEVYLARVDEPEGLYCWGEIWQAMGRFCVVEFSMFAGSGAEEGIDLGIHSATRFEYRSGAVGAKGDQEKSHAGYGSLAALCEASEQYKVVMYCQSSGEIKRVREILEEEYPGCAGRFDLRNGYIKQGFVHERLGVVVVGHHEVFGQASIRRRIRSIRSASPVESLLDLKKGDYVVHVSYGIGKFVSIQQIAKGETTEEYLLLEYADGVRLNVPVRNIGLVHKYVGAMQKRPRLSKIGTKKWEKQKEKVAQGVSELAAEMLEMQAKRTKLGGISFGEDTVWQREFEESFAYQETPDQLRAAAEIKEDMKRAVAMDRLLCGDVGYGKTELAMRAAFKAVEGGKQVAVLVPTTVLSIQHARTFAERFADFPVRIEVVNRFVTAKDSREIVKAARGGRVDVLIGTHRLLSQDVGFADLGLLIIDEEQRFGVEHKERLKRFRVNVDVLTMTATPIPRTLHLSLLGLRDISSLATAPMDRRSIVTKVCRFDEGLIRRAIVHELNRQGQVFFVHNRVQSIESMAAKVAEIIGDEKVRVDVAHGQMHHHELENAMIRFVRGITDVLVCSTIIESGLDIPNANTMIINDADKFGLSQLHQLRGRVGRYKHRAYAYMLMPLTRTVTPVAAKRLKAIEEYSQLGSGFRIALRDLEIRGAGNILGAEQSGHIHTVGYELYCQMLSRAVRELRDEPVEPERMTLVDPGFSTYIPKSYIPSDRQRMDAYRRIACAKSQEDLKGLREELADLFGPVPREVELLLDLSEIRVLATGWGIKSLVRQEMDLIFTFEHEKNVGDIFAKAPGSVRIPNPKTVYVRLSEAYFEPLTLMSVLRKMLGRTKRKYTL